MEITNKRGRNMKTEIKQALGKSAMTPRSPENDDEDEINVDDQEEAATTSSAASANKRVSSFLKFSIQSILQHAAVTSEAATQRRAIARWESRIV